MPVRKFLLELASCRLSTAHRSDSLPTSTESDSPLYSNLSNSPTPGISYRRLPVSCACSCPVHLVGHLLAFESGSDRDQDGNSELVALPGTMGCEWVLTRMEGISRAASWNHVQ
ncbi:hypothetical protein FB45DRAFT_937206 [Roridomyces roridus]|uniref:Uncharacterized protein n=1 Tax=Roridomyces roridus TaxID=1738132 RepID=A0AAD7FBX1_9AGAR|nr:hypothetical protein FB45DRAFT_937206 [Roridomyces roridus]